MGHFLKKKKKKGGYPPPQRRQSRSPPAGAAVIAAGKRLCGVKSKVPFEVRKLKGRCKERRGKENRTFASAERRGKTSDF